MSVIDVYFLHLAVCAQNTSTERHLQTWVSHVYLLMRSSPCPWGVEQIPCKGNSYQLLESTISSFQSELYTFNHSWRSGHKSTHKLRALPMGSGAFLHCNGLAFSMLLSFVNKSVTSARAGPCDPAWALYWSHIYHPLWVTNSVKSWPSGTTRAPFSAHLPWIFPGIIGQWLVTMWIKHGVRGTDFNGNASHIVTGRLITY